MKVQIIKTQLGIVAAAWQDNLLEGITLPQQDTEEALAILADYLKVKNPSFDISMEKNENQRVLEEKLRSYFSGDKVNFDLPINWSRVTPFQQKVLQAVARIPYGATLSYGEIAKLVGNPKGSRAVGGAVGANPWALVVP